MWGMFAGASAFDQPLSFDTSRVTTMNALLLEAKAVNPPLSFDTSRVTEMGSQDVRLRDEFSQPLSFDTSRVTHMGARMFEGAASLSAANKLLIRCAWAGTSAFASAGYGSSWAQGSCVAPSPEG